VASCLALTDRDACCAVFERVALGTGFVNQAGSRYPCIPAITSYYTSAVCLPSMTAAASYPSQQAACPPRIDAIGAARPRLKLPSQVPCSSLTDRYKCANALDGRSAAAYANQACIPARTRFQNAKLCEVASWVAAIDPTSAASSTEFAEPNVTHSPTPPSPHLSYAGLHHEVQRITLRQATPERSVQFISFAAIECDDPTYDCIAGNQSGTVQLRHGGKLGAAVELASGGAAEIASSFNGALADQTYGELTATVELSNNSHVIWKLEILTAWSSCTAQVTLTLTLTLTVTVTLTLTLTPTPTLTRSTATVPTSRASPTRPT
jgi:hypothetical protein